MESTLKSMVISLFVITFAGAAAVGGVYRLTKEPIAQAKAAQMTTALSDVLPPFDNDPMETRVVKDVDGIPVAIHTATMGGELVGYAVETATMQGFNGLIRMMAGFLPDGTIYNIQVLEHTETPGFGDVIAKPDNVLLVSFRGNNPANLRLSVRRDGGDIDAITAATVTSRAYVDAVARGFNALMRMTGSDAVSGDSTASGAYAADSTATPINQQPAGKEGIHE